jgi:hypothetical protein
MVMPQGGRDIVITDKRKWADFCLVLSIILFVCSCGPASKKGGTAQVSLTTAASPPGYGSVNPSGTTYHNINDVVTVTATANSGYEFSYWSGDLTGSENPETITMDTSKSVTAHFILATYKLIVYSLYGAPEPPVGTTEYTYGSLVTVSCGPTPIDGPAGTRYRCTGWIGGSGDIPIANSATSYPFTITQHCTIIWDWVIQHYLTISVSPVWPVEGGTVYQLSDGWYDKDVPVELTAKPREGFEFTEWSEDLSTSNNPEAVTMDGPKRVTANFSILNPRTITVTSSYGEPAPLVGTTACPYGCSATLSCGPDPYPGITGTRYKCTGWEDGSGDVTPTGGDNFYTISSVTENSTITWIWKTQYQLSITIIPTGSGTVTLTPLPEPNNWYDSNTVVSLSATANQYYNWVEWSGDPVTNPDEPNTEITMNVPKSVTANFLGDPRSVTVDAPPGTSPNPPIGTTYYHYGNSVTVSCGITPYPGPPGTRYACTGWTNGSGNIPATGSTTSYTFTITLNCTITWTWRTQYHLVVSINPSGSGTVTPPTGWYNENTVLPCTATPSQGYTWVEWSGDLVGTANPQDLIMNGPKAITGNFKPSDYDVIVSSPCGDPKPSGTTNYTGGSLVTVCCGPDPYPPGATGTRDKCTGWTDGSGDIPATGTATSYTFIITQNSTITWTWKTQYQLTTAANPVSGGTVTPASGGWYDSGSVVSCDATVAAGYGWVGWSGDLDGAQKPQNLTMNSPKTVTANFIKPVLTVSNPTGADTPRPGEGTYVYKYGGTATCSVSSQAFPVPVTPFTEGFEAGMSEWALGGNADWSNITAPVHSGAYSASTKPTINGQSSYIERTFTIEAGGGTGTFWWKAIGGSSSLKFYIDGSEQVVISGTVDWQLRTFSLAAGTKTLKWEFYRGYQYSGTTRGWIDDITVTNTSSGTFTEGFESGTLSGWMTGGDVTWYAAGVHSGAYCAQSGSISHNQSTYIEREFIIGPHGGTVTFWWRVSSEADHDWLEFYIDNVLQAGRISGETGWAQVTFALAGGIRTLRWRYVKDSSGSAVGDCGWIDDIIVTIGPLAEGFEDGNIRGWTTSPNPKAWYAWSPTAEEEARGLQPCSGIYSARSGVLVGNNQESYIRRTFTIGAGGGSVRFSWKVSSESGYDYLEFYVDDEPVPRAWISGEVGWTEMADPQVTRLEAGTRTLKWRFVKDSSDLYPVGNNCGWVDDIFVATGPSDPGTRYTCTGYTGTGSCPSGTGISVTFTITRDSSITWNWRVQNRLTVNVDPADSGTVHIFTASGDGYYDIGTIVTLMANASIRYVFDHWSGDLTGTDSVQNLTMDGPKSVTAVFAGPNRPSALSGTADSTSAITWTWTSSGTDWQAIAGGVLRTVAATLEEFQTSYGDLPVSETCPRSGTGNDRLLFEAADDLPGGDPQDCPTISAAAANLYTIAYIRVSSSQWTCTADAQRDDLNDYYIDQTGVLREEMSTGEGSQANSGSPLSFDNAWFEIHKVNPAGPPVTVYPNITTYQETGLTQNTQYTRHVHNVSYGVYSDPTNEVSRYTLVHNATTDDFSLSVSSATSSRIIGTGTVPVWTYPIDIAHNYARCQMLYLASEVGQVAMITKIRFQRASGDDDTVNNVQVHMIETTSSTISDWVTSGLVLVYNGNLSIPADVADTWFEILLATPFSYNGTKNLLISFRHQDGSAESTYTQWKVDSTKTDRCIAGYSDTTNPPPLAGSPWYLPNVGLEFAGTVTITVTAPPNPGAGSTGVLIERDLSDTFPAPRLVRDYAPTYTYADNKVGSGIWYYRIRFRNGDEQSSAYSNGISIPVP